MPDRMSCIFAAPARTERVWCCFAAAKPGADDERIIDDYLKSAENLREELARAAAENPDIDLGVITPDRSYMEEFLRSVSF